MDKYGIYGRPRGTSKKPKFIGFVLASTQDEAIEKARVTKGATLFTITHAKKLGKTRRTIVAFGKYVKAVGEGY